MSDPERQGSPVDRAPKVRGKPFRNYLAMFLADMTGRLEKSYADLKKQLSESLERETATSEVLGIVSRSPADLGPVFETILANATRLCEASYGTLWLCKGDTFRAAALHGAEALPDAYAAELRRTRVPSQSGGSIARAARTRQTVHVA